MPPRPDPALLRPVNQRRLWRACARCSIEVNSRVYYFPQGHLEQCFTPSDHPPLSNLVLSKPSILCRVAAVRLDADSVTDEVCAEITLIPLDLSSSSSSADLSLGRLESPPLLPPQGLSVVDDNIPVFAKILTSSDVAHRFYVPKSCVESIFPPFQGELSKRVLPVTDIHGKSWHFNYSASPPNHWLGEGWTNFVKSKTFVAGDVLVWMRDPNGETLMGVRKNVGGWKERVDPEAVMAAVDSAARSLQFQVVCYPRAGLYSDFLVQAEVVDAALTRDWRAGMIVKMEMVIGPKLKTLQGTVTAVSQPDDGPWRGSSWRMLQITWDEREVPENIKTLSPWQVEFVRNPPQVLNEDEFLGNPQMLNPDAFGNNMNPNASTEMNIGSSHPSGMGTLRLFGADIRMSQNVEFDSVSRNVEDDGSQGNN